MLAFRLLVVMLCVWFGLLGGLVVGWFAVVRGCVLVSI